MAESNDDELIDACGLDRDRDAARIRLMLELVRRVGCVHARRGRLNAGPTAGEKRARLERATRAIAAIGTAWAELSVVTSTWLELGPDGSPPIARWTIARRIATHLSLPDPPSRFVRVWMRDGKRVDGAPFDDVAIAIETPPPAEACESNPTRDTRELARGLEDLAFVLPEYITKILGAIGEAADQTLAELTAGGQTTRSEASRDVVMRDLALIFHAVHRTDGRGAIAARTRFVHRALKSLGEARRKKSVENRLRKKLFGISAPDSLEGFSDVPPPVELDAEALLEALRATLGTPSRADALAPLTALLGGAAEIVMIGQP